MGDDQIVTSSGQDITPESVASRSFASAFRGYHPVEVKQFLQEVSDALAAGAGREAELRRAVQEAQTRASHPELDEATVTNILGEHAAKLLASARDTAASITAEAQRQAQVLLREAEARVARMREEADGLMAKRVAEADTVADSIKEAAEADARAAIEQATYQGKEMVKEARAVRERMLADLARRRRSAQVQIEQLLAARDRLVTAYDVVRRTVEEATLELDAAEPEARLAAEAVGRRSDGENGRRPDPAPAPRPPRAAAAAPPPAEREAPAPASSLLRRIDRTAPAPAERPRLRPQSVAGSVADRLPASAAMPELEPLAPSVPPPPAVSPEPVSELSTMEVPVITADTPPPPAAPTGAVDELFARIRATESVPEPEAPSVAPPPSRPPASVDPVTGERALEGRDELLENLEAGLARALKRVLGDEQNEVLDTLRRLGPGTEVLPHAQAQASAYRDAALPWLQQAVRAGAGFVSDPGAQAEPPTAAVNAQAVALAAELVDPLRDRLTRALEAGADAGDASVAAESLRATYRQWKVQQVEECARHHAVAAFSAGAFEATPDVASLQWLVDDDGHCPDCDDNALAGPTAKGQPFPTGQLHPPAHPGCRCLLVPVDA